MIHELTRTCDCHRVFFERDSGGKVLRTWREDASPLAIERPDGNADWQVGQPVGAFPRLTK